jgi:hypothetical protein
VGFESDLDKSDPQVFKRRGHASSGIMDDVNANLEDTQIRKMLTG